MICAPSSPNCSGVSSVVRTSAVFCVVALLYVSCCLQPNSSASTAAVINARFIKPIDDELVLRYCTPGAKVITVEEGSLAGGFGSAIMERVQELKIEGVEFERIGIPDVYVHHGAQDVLRAEFDLLPDGIAARVKRFVAPGENVRRVVSSR